MSLDDIFVYEQHTGRLLWRELRNGPRTGRDQEAGSISHGYRRVSLNGKRQAVHRVIWEMMRGPIPVGMEIDHIDGCRSNNLLDNLRLVSATGNMRNKGLHINSPTGLLGVNPHSNGFKVTCLGRYVGWFRDFFEACCARKSAERRNGFHFNHGRASS